MNATPLHSPFPPLPQPDGYAAISGGGTIIVPPSEYAKHNAYAVFTADQMRDYALSAITSQPLVEVQEPVAHVRTSELEKLKSPMIAGRGAMLFKVTADDTTALYAAPVRGLPLTEERIEAAAKILAGYMDYPWEHMPTQGRITMRKHAKSVIEAANGIREGS